MDEGEFTIALDSQYAEAFKRLRSIAESGAENCGYRTVQSVMDYIKELDAKVLKWQRKHCPKE